MIEDIMSPGDMTVEELAAALAAPVAEALRDSTKETVEEACTVLGVDDGEEMMFEGVLKHPVLGPEAIAEALIARPEVYDAFVKIAKKLISRTQGS